MKQSKSFVRSSRKSKESANEKRGSLDKIHFVAKVRKTEHDALSRMIQDYPIALRLDFSTGRLITPGHTIKQKSTSWTIYTTSRKSAYKKIPELMEAIVEPLSKLHNSVVSTMAIATESFRPGPRSLDIHLDVTSISKEVMSCLESLQILDRVVGNSFMSNVASELNSDNRVLIDEALISESVATFRVVINGRRFPEDVPFTRDDPIEPLFN